MNWFAQRRGGAEEAAAMPRSRSNATAPAARTPNLRASASPREANLENYI
jgi:hypothetical protein